MLVEYTLYEKELKEACSMFLEKKGIEAHPDDIKMVINEGGCKACYSKLDVDVKDQYEGDGQ